MMIKQNEELQSCSEFADESWFFMKCQHPPQITLIHCIIWWKTTNKQPFRLINSERHHRTAPTPQVRHRGQTNTSCLLRCWQLNIGMRKTHTKEGANSHRLWGWHTDLDDITEVKGREGIHSAHLPYVPFRIGKEVIRQAYSTRREYWLERQPCLLTAVCLECATVIRWGAVISK